MSSLHWPPAFEKPSLNWCVNRKPETQMRAEWHPVRDPPIVPSEIETSALKPEQLCGLIWRTASCSLKVWNKNQICSLDTSCSLYTQFLKQIWCRTRSVITGGNPLPKRKILSKIWIWKLFSCFTDARESTESTFLTYRSLSVNY